MIGWTNAPAWSLRVFSHNALHGRSLNPREPALSPRGSSGGAGAAVAVGIGPIAHGNDIGGSIRIPSYNPSEPGTSPVSARLMAVEGPLARAVHDASLALMVMAQGDPRDRRWADAPLAGPAVSRQIRVALMANNPGGFTHPAQAEAVRQAGRHLAAAGCAVEEVAPPDPDEAIEVWRRVSPPTCCARWRRCSRVRATQRSHLSQYAWCRTGPAIRAGRCVDLAGAA